MHAILQVLKASIQYSNLDFKTRKRFTWKPEGTRLWPFKTVRNRFQDTENIRKLCVSPFPWIRWIVTVRRDSHNNFCSALSHKLVSFVARLWGRQYTIAFKTATPLMHNPKQQKSPNKETTRGSNLKLIQLLDRKILEIFLKRILQDSCWRPRQPLEVIYVNGCEVQPNAVRRTAQNRCLKTTEGWIGHIFFVLCISVHVSVHELLHVSLDTSRYASICMSKMSFFVRQFGCQCYLTFSDSSWGAFQVILPASIFASMSILMCVIAWLTSLLFTYQFSAYSQCVTSPVQSYVIWCVHLYFN